MRRIWSPLIIAASFSVLASCGATEEAAPAAEEATVEEVAVSPEENAESRNLDVDVFAGSGEEVAPGQCGDIGTVQFPWPPPEPTDRVKLDARWFGVSLYTGLQVSDVAEAVESALRAVGHIAVGFNSVGCDGFAVISQFERIDAEGRPQEGSSRFLPPGEQEPWSIERYLAQLLSAPEGKYRQIVIVGTDRDWGEFDDPPTSSEMLNLSDNASNILPQALEDYAWRRKHQLVALIYEFDRPAGKGDPIPVPPRGLGATTHLTGAGLYKTGN